MLMTAPPRSFIDFCQASCVHMNGPVRLVSYVFCHRGRSASITGPMYGLVAALLTRMSTAPKRSRVASMHASASSWRPAWPAKISTSPFMVEAASLRPSSLRELSITRAPASAKAAAMARPMPFDAPVTMATLPSSLRSIRGTLGCRCEPYLGPRRPRTDARDGQPPGRRDESLPAPAPGQPRRLVPVGRGGVLPRHSRGQAHPAVDRVLGVPLVPRDGARVVRGSRHGQGDERPLRVRESRPRG